MSIRLDLVYNPASGSFRGKRLHALRDALERAGFSPRLVATTPDGVTIAPDAQLVCVHGGDGAVRMAAQSLGERLATVPLAIAPAGTINLLARELGYAANPRRFAAQLAGAWQAGERCWLRSPVLTCNGQPVLACLSIGPDSCAVAGVSLALKSRIGRLAYPIAALSQLRRWPRAGISVQAKLADGSMIDASAEAVFIARGRFYAGPFSLSPAARLDAPGFELVLLEKAGRRRSLAFALAVAAGLSPVRFGLARIYSAGEVRLDGGAMPAQIDGDAIAPGPLTLKMSGYCARFCV